MIMFDLIISQQVVTTEIRGFLNMLLHREKFETHATLK